MNPIREPSLLRAFQAKHWGGLFCIPFFAVHAFADQKQAFEQTIQPVLKQYCIDCHSTKKQKGDLDLERFTSLELVKRDPIVWEHSLDQIRDKEMPPKGKPKPSPEQTKLLTDWMQGTLDDMAFASAGDPGPVVLRRLSNMEYTYTLRDLTGVDSLDPAKEFPVDGAAGEGFTNVGAALVMSPALLTKYLDAVIA
jgi:mono/diheme cytochrome c family protein